MDQIELGRLEEAILAFYSTSAQEKNATHDWLTKAQTSPQAWQFTWQLMQPGKPQEVQFYGAITLHTKLIRHWHEIPQEMHEELKQKILESIITFSNEPKLVLNRLCIALSAFVVHMLSEWPTAIEDIINTFQNQNIPNVNSKKNQLWIMLEVLQAIPEEMQAILTSVKRATLRNEVAKRSDLILQTIENYLLMEVKNEWNNESIENMTRAIKCLNIWVKSIGFNLEKCESIANLLLKIVNRCYWPCVQDPNDDGCMTADDNDLAEICLKTLTNIIMQPECDLYPKAAYVLIKLFLDSLVDITKMEWRHENKNEDLAVNIYTLFVSSMERHSQLLLRGISSNDRELSDLCNRLINEILHCTDKPGIYPVEESCSSMALSFWFLLQDEIFSITDTERRNKCWEYIKPMYAHLTRILVRKAEQPDDNSLDKWTEDDIEQFRCYRQDISDTFMYSYDVLHDGILDILSAILDETVAEIRENPHKWTRLEACIFCFQSVAEHVSGERVKQISNLLQIISEIPYDKGINEKLLGTSLECIGAYCQWFKDNPNYLPIGIDLLMRGLNSSRSAQATLGLKELCRDCQLQLKQYAEPLLNACQSSLSAGHIKNSDSTRLMFSVGKLMSMLPTDTLPRYLDVIVSPCFEELHSICQSKTKTAATRLRTTFRLNMISTLFSSLNTNFDDDDNNQGAAEEKTVQPVLIIMQQTMHIFREIAEFWSDDILVLETACGALKHAIVNLKCSFKPMLQDLCYFIVSIFRTQCSTPAIEISQTAIVVFYKDKSCELLMQQLLIELIQHTFQLFESTPEDGFSNISETVDIFYACLTQITKKMPEALDKENIDQNRLVYYALKAITLPETGPIRSGIQFLSHYISQSRNHVSLMQAVMAAGEQIVRTAMLCVCLVTPRQQVEKFADIFLAINKKYPAELVAWLKAVGQMPDFPTPLVSDMEKKQFITQIYKEKVNKRLLQKHLNDFALKARGLSNKFE